MKKEEKYTANIGNLKVSGSAKDIHGLALVYGLASCECGHQITDEICDKHRDDLIKEMEEEQKMYQKIEKQLIDVIRNSDYYKDYSSELSSLIDDVMKEIEHDERELNRAAKKGEHYEKED